MKIGIIGSGISGISSAYYLSKDFDVTLFEKNTYLGGHTNTIFVEENGVKKYVDTGFIVFNDKTYPNLCNLFDELKIESIDTQMSTSVFNKINNLQYSGKSFWGLFAQKRNFFNIKFIKMLMEIQIFFKKSKLNLDKLDPNITLYEFVNKYNYSSYFKDNFLIPMGSAVWTTPIHKMIYFPAITYIQFFKNHGFLDLENIVQWKSVKNGSRTYIDRIIEKNLFHYKLNSPVLEINKTNGKYIIKTKIHSEKFDKVILACHADDAFQLTKNLEISNIDILKKFKYEKNTALLHTDENAMPPIKSAWSAWNFKVYPNGKTSTVYWMNFLQKLNYEKQYFVSINENDPLNPNKIIKKFEYEHPLFDVDSLNYQKFLDNLNSNGNVYFCGAYFKYGFHEDGIKSAIDIVKRIKNHE